MDDFDLLQAYASQRKEDAFSKLTARYLNLVYSAALRQTSNPQSAEDVTQAVFLTLARKAGSISRKTILAGWLVRTTHFAAANARRLEQRRQHYEQQAMQSSLNPYQDDATWKQVSPLLDEALNSLNETDRAAVALRFLEHKSLRQVAEAIGTSEDAAQKRVTRAIEKLRTLFTRRGKALSGLALTAALASRSVEAVPEGLASGISAAVTTQGALAGSSVATLVQATADALTRAKLRLLAPRAIGTAIVVSLAIVALAPAKHPIPPGPSGPMSFLLETNPLKDLPRIASIRPVTADATTVDAHIHFLVLDSKSDAPVSNARLTLVSDSSSRGRTTNTFTTDPEGVALILYTAEPAKSWRHKIEIFHDGYVPKFVTWSDYQQDLVDEIPDEYDVRLDPAVTIGGVVLDEQDAPVAGMKVVFTVSGPIASRSRERPTMGGNYHTELADAQGRWSCNHVPARFGMIEYRLVHPEYQEMIFASDSPETDSFGGVERVAQADLLAGRAILRARRGLVVAGIVVDEMDRPVAGAKVTQEYFFRSADRTKRTGSDGSFRFSNVRPSQLALTIQTAGLAPVVTSLAVNASVENLRFTLPRGELLLGRVVNEMGQAIVEASIEPASPSHDSRTLFEWHTKTDADGRFSWDSAPISQSYAIYADGYQSQERLTLIADGTERTIKLANNGRFDPVSILGEVVDLETGAPPAKATVQIWETTHEPNGNWSSFTTRPEDVASDGKFRLKTSPNTISYVLEIQADSYSPERLTNEVTGEREIHLRIGLKKEPLSTGVVVTSAGEAAAGATLAVCGANEWAQMHQPGRLRIGSPGVPATVTDSEGHFCLPPKHSPESVVVAHPDGFAELPFSQMGSNVTITLQPWGRIEGTLTLAGQARSDETIQLDGGAFAGSSHLSLFLSRKTDANGRFAFEMVPAGEYKVDWRPGFRDEKLGMIPLSHGVPVLVRAGETAQATMGGTGRSIVGKIVVPGREKPIDWTQDIQSLELKLPKPADPVLPKPSQFASESAYAAALQKATEEIRVFMLSDEGKALQRAERTYVPLFNADGSFHIDDIPPGTYRLRIALTEPIGNDSPVRPRTPIGTLETELIVPENSEEAPIDLGTLSLVPTTHHETASRE